VTEGRRFSIRRIVRSAAPALALLTACETAGATGSADPPLAFADRDMNRRVSLARYAEDPVTAADALLAELAARPEAIGGLGTVAVVDLQAGLQRVEARDAERAVLEALIARDWKPRGSLLPRPSAFDVRLALLRIEAGDADGARAALATVWRAGDVVDVLIDRRFEPLWAEIEAAGSADLGAALERARAEARDLAAEEPRSLEPVLYELGALRQAGRAAEAVALGRTVRPRLVDAVAPAYDDIPLYEDAILNALAFALVDLGEMSEAHGALRQAEGDDRPLMGGRVRAASGSPTQAINAAVLLLWDGRFREAARRVSGIRREQLTDAGLRSLLAVRACAAAQLGNEAEVAARLAELETDREANLEALHLALLCADRQDALAALTIWRLETEQHRLPALRTLQVYAPPPRTPSFKATLDARLAALRARPDVAAAAERVGRIESWAIVQ
jgi:hypothetical protein